MSEPDQGTRLSNADIAILNLLQQDAARPRQDMADAAGMSPSTLWRRISELEAVGVIRNRVALLDAEKVGISVCVFVFVNLINHDRKTRESFEDFVARTPSIMESFLVTGGHDYILIAKTRSVSAFERLLMDYILPHDSVSSASSNIALRQQKYTTALPL